MDRVTAAAASEALDAAQGIYRELFGHGTLEVGFYRPVGRDRQQPHDRDEVYVIASGSGTFFCDGERSPFGPGDVLFVRAGAEHRFEDFSEGFTTWVFFYGPKGGEQPAS
jgi:mannose-6-phosphate isomerase-like protein (cupin superfamily)